MRRVAVVVVAVLALAGCAIRPQDGADAPAVEGRVAVHDAAKDQRHARSREAVVKGRHVTVTTTLGDLAPIVATRELSDADVADIEAAWRRLVVDEHPQRVSTGQPRASIDLAVGGGGARALQQNPGSPRYEEIRAILALLAGDRLGDSPRSWQGRIEVTSPAYLPQVWYREATIEGRTVTISELLPGGHERTVRTRELTDGDLAALDRLPGGDPDVPYHPLPHAFLNTVDLHGEGGRRLKRRDSVASPDGRAIELGYLIVAGL